MISCKEICQSLRISFNYKAPLSYKVLTYTQYVEGHHKDLIKSVVDVRLQKYIWRRTLFQFDLYTSSVNSFLFPIVNLPFLGLQIRAASHSLGVALHSGTGGLFRRRSQTRRHGIQGLISKAQALSLRLVTFLRSPAARWLLGQIGQGALFKINTYPPS